MTPTVLNPRRISAGDPSASLARGRPPTEFRRPYPEDLPALPPVQPTDSPRGRGRFQARSRIPMRPWIPFFRLPHRADPAVLRNNLTANPSKAHSHFCQTRGPGVAWIGRLFRVLERSTSCNRIFSALALFPCCPTPALRSGKGIAIEPSAKTPPWRPANLTMASSRSRILRPCLGHLPRGERARGITLI